ncbi:SRPBCC family protein [Streptomyces litchfieldiae]|uniref:SRPBCC domain-containing protein n=1 Tax=Streptomyces litchfieldiae TaxID=3075543 RepID=A0ABU2MTN7_9ACTN|nr:SRPBCC domain-containing protein [Streptomyces sp. DSM 44938]MDT0345006.1 SRPBCC domain-containing protein [Streptomyces sp. DSM 44938]
MEHEVFLPYPAEMVRSAFAEPGRTVRCVPGLHLDPEADPAAPAGRLRVRIGSSSITYRGTLTWTWSEDGGRLTVEGRATEARGAGSATVTLTVMPRPVPDGTGTTLRFHGTVESTGRLGEFTTGQRQAAARRLLDRFAESLAEELALAEEPTPTAGGIGEPDDNERAIPGIPAAPEPEPEPGFLGGVPERDLPPPSLDPELDADIDADLDDEDDDVLAAAGRSPLRGPAEDEDGIALPEPEADFARRTMIGRSAEEVDHAPPRGRYAPEPAPGSAPGAAAALRWAAPAAAVALATVIVVTRILRRRR